VTKKLFHQDVDIKNRETPAPFAFVQFTDILGVVKAIHMMEQDGYIGNNKVKVRNIKNLSKFFCRFIIIDEQGQIFR